MRSSLLGILGSNTIADAIMSAIGRAIVSGLHNMLNTVMNGLLGAMTATTAIDLANVVRPDRAIGVVVALAAVPVIIAAVCQAIFQHRPKEALLRGVVAPILTGVILLVADTLITGVLVACSAASWALVNLGLPGGSSYFVTTWTGFAAATAAGGAAVGGATGGVEGAVGESLAAVVMLVLVTILISFTIWMELSLRAAVIYLLAAMVPIALVGLYWKRLTSWLVRLAEIIVAVALSQVVITMAMVLGTTLIGKAIRAQSGGVGMELANVVQGLGLLFLASLGLPLTLRLVPMAVDAAIHPGAVGYLAFRSLGSRVGVGGGNGPDGAPMGIVRRLSTAPVRAMQGFSFAGKPDAAERAGVVGTLRTDRAKRARTDAGSAKVDLLANSSSARLGARIRKPGLSHRMRAERS